MSKMLSSLAFCAVCAGIPQMAPAAVFNVDLVANQSFSDAQVISPGGSVEYAFTVLELLDVAAFSLSATGNNSGDDVAAITFGFTSPPTNSFTTIEIIADASFGGGFLPGGSFAPGDTFSIFFGDGVQNDASVTLSFDTTSPVAVPLPAAGLMLAAALMGIGVFGARRKALA